jgi:hypothetical protein
VGFVILVLKGMDMHYWVYVYDRIDILFFVSTDLRFVLQARCFMMRTAPLYACDRAPASA